MPSLAPSQAVVIFGASGDLTRRKLLPAFYHLFLQGLLPKGFVIVGYARTSCTDEQFRELAHESVRRFGRHAPDGEVWSDFANHLHYVTGEFADPGAMDHIVHELERVDAEHGTQGNRFFYAATPQDAYPDIVKRIGETGYFSTTTAILADVVYEQGRYDEALQLSEEAEEAGVADDVMTQVLWRVARSKALARLGEPEEGERLAREAVARARKTDDLNETAVAFSALGETLRVAGREDEAREALAEALELYERKGNVVMVRRTQEALAS